MIDEPFSKQTAVQLSMININHAKLPQLRNSLLIRVIVILLSPPGSGTL